MSEYLFLTTCYFAEYNEGIHVVDKGYVQYNHFMPAMIHMQGEFWFLMLNGGKLGNMMVKFVGIS